MIGYYHQGIKAFLSLEPFFPTYIYFTEVPIINQNANQQIGRLCLQNNTLCKDKQIHVQDAKKVQKQNRKTVARNETRRFC